MKRKFGKKNIIMFILFSFFVILLIGLFVFIVIKALSFDKTTYTVNPKSFIYDVNNNYVLTEGVGELTKQWDKHYYLSYNNSKLDMGTDVVVFNSNDAFIYVYGNNYGIDLNGNVTYNQNKTEVLKNGTPSFYKLDDRKYLIVAGNIKTLKEEINTNNYLIVEINKQGNALLLNNDLNIKTLNTLVLSTGTYDFDVANEKLIIGEDEIDLKKVSGSTNQYVEPEIKGDSSNNSNSNGSGSNFNGNGGGYIGGGTIGGSTTIVDTDKELNIVKSANLYSISVASSYIDVYYSVIDPKNEYTSVYLLINGIDFEQKIVLNKGNTMYRIMNLQPGTSYTISFGYTSLSSGNTSVMQNEVINSFDARTSELSSSIKVTKVNSNQLHFTVKYDSAYAFESANVVIYFGNNVIGSVPVNTDAALSAEGFTSFISYDGFLTAGTFELKLENCIYNGIDVSSKLNISTKYVNSF